MNGGHGEKLSRLQEQAIAALLTCPTIAKAAGKAGCSVRALKDWLHDPDFSAAYAEARREVLSGTVGMLLSSCADAVKTLKANLKRGKPGEQTRAALGILDRAVKYTDQLEFAERLEDLERRLNAHEGKPS